MITYNGKNGKAIKVCLVRDLSDIERLKLGPDQYFDLVTPYGYGGFLVEGDLPESFEEEYIEFCREHRFVSEFTRMCPFVDVVHPFGEVVELGATVSMDTSSIEMIEHNLTSKNRNMVRKAIKNGVAVDYGVSPLLIDEFIKLYTETMVSLNASEYYYFSSEFFRQIFIELPNNTQLFYARSEDNIVAMAIILYANNKAHYHFSCSTKEGQRLAATNLLLVRVAEWCNEQSIHSLHLGGGVGGSNSDSLFSFKKSFNKNSYNPYSVGKLIVDHNLYNRFSEGCEETGFFPKYRETMKE
ncbi:MAG: GNAT family N-acetyltransferase [Sphaerochaetaceae bacterium]